MTDKLERLLEGNPLAVLLAMTVNPKDASDARTSAVLTSYTRQVVENGFREFAARVLEDALERGVMDPRIDYAGPTIDDLITEWRRQ